MEVNIDELLKIKSHSYHMKHRTEDNRTTNKCSGACCFCSNKLPMSLCIDSIEHQSIMAATDIHIFGRVHTHAHNTPYTHIRPFYFIFAYHVM